jgi:hypothetical protein
LSAAGRATSPLGLRSLRRQFGGVEKAELTIAACVCLAALAIPSSVLALWPAAHGPQSTLTTLCFCGCAAVDPPRFSVPIETEVFQHNSPIHLISCGFRAPHRCTSSFCHIPIQLCESRRRSIRQSAVWPLVIV